MRLNLGCGTDVRPDYTNVDFRKTHPDVVEVDLSSFPWPWADASVDEVMMLDFLEHFPRHMTSQILLECYRVLKKGGVLQVQVPDMTILGGAMVRASIPCHQCGATMQANHDRCLACGELWRSVQDAAFGRMYGGQDYPGNFHQAGFSFESLADTLMRHGFVGMQRLEYEHQYKNWNFKVAARKF